MSSKSDINRKTWSRRKTMGGFGLEDGNGLSGMKSGRKRGQG